MPFSRPRLAVLALLSVSPCFAADADPGAAQDQQDQAAGRVSTRLQAAGGAFELRQGPGDLPNGPGQAQARLAAAPAPASGLVLTATKPAADRTMDRIAVPGPVAAPAPAKTSASSPEVVAAAQAAWTEARSQLSAPRPPGGIPTERLEPAARAAAQALLGKLPASGPTEPAQAVALAMSTVQSGSAVTVKPNIAFDTMRLGMDVAVARDMDPGRGVLKGNPALTAGFTLGSPGRPGATTLDVAWRPAGRDRDETKRLSGETILLARKDSALKLNGSVTTSPVADTAYKVGLTVAARIF